MSACHRDVLFHLSGGGYLTAGWQIVSCPCSVKIILKLITKYPFKNIYDAFFSLKIMAK